LVFKTEYSYAPPNTVQVFICTLIAACGTYYMRLDEIWYSMALKSDGGSEFIEVLDLLMKEWPLTLLIIFLT
jgi:hypothetical protein